MGIVAKYKFDGSVYADLIPEFNAEFTSDLYTVTDEVDSENSNHIIRTIESDSLPTQIYFGLHNTSNTATSREASLLSIEYLDVSQCTNLAQLCRYCYNVETVNCGDWDTSNLKSVLWLFEGCRKLKSVDIRNWDTSKIDGIGAMFSGCISITSIDMSLWDTVNVTNLMYLFASCNSLTTIDISNMIISEGNSLEGFITEGCTSLKYIKCNIPDTIQKISSLLPTRTTDDPGTIIYQGAETLSSDVITELNSKGWNVVASPQLIAKYKYDSKIYKNLIPVFNEGYMGFIEDEEVDGNGVVTRVIEHVELPTLMRFGVNSNEGDNRTNSLKEVLYLDTSNLSSLWRAFSNCRNVTKINTSNWNTSKVTDMSFTFHACFKLTELDVTGFDTSNVTNMQQVFMSSSSLKELDLSNWDTSKISNVQAMFYYTILQKLDISNFNLGNVNTSNSSSVNYFITVPTLTDIGMIYCDQSTINKVASLLPTDHNITIWVESDDILQYDQYDHITYKTQKVQDTVHLNSPLLKGDTIEVIDGKTYHVHRYEEIQYQDLKIYHTTSQLEVLGLQLFKIRHDIRYESTDTDISNLITQNCTTVKPGLITAKNQLYTTQDGNIWLSIEANTEITWEEAKQRIGKAIAKLATPYYELISEEPLELTLLDTTDNTINNNSILPSNMTIANKELSTIAIKPSTTYTLSFDKSNVDSEVTIDICGGEQLTTVLNRIELTTPSELGSGIRFISSDGCIISNVRLLEGSLVEKAIPKETFEGLQNSFDDGYIIGENLIDKIITNVGQYGTFATIPAGSLKPSTNYTLILRNNGEYIKGYVNEYFFEGNSTDRTLNITTNNCFIRSYKTLNSISATETRLLKSWDAVSNIDIEVVFLEGDHTHLSEAELMRYIEKGTSHYEEEDYNHVGKYKVQYKVTGKNKFSGYGNITYIKPNTAYKFSSSVTSDATRLNFAVYDKNGNNVGENVKVQNLGGYSTFYFNTTSGKFFTGIDSSIVNTGFILQGEFDYIIIGGSQYTNLQLEEGTVATEYEPYKEDIKTYYLSSPLLEGDTIEDINGVATHVRRYEKVVLDGSSDEPWVATKTWDDNVLNNTTYLFNMMDKNRIPICDIKIAPFSDKFIGICSESMWGITITSDYEFIQVYADGNVYIRILQNKINGYTTEAIKAWLSENPTTLVYKLRTPIYEPISDEPILLDSYTNGHLDLSNENIPIQKTEFRYFVKELAYLQPSTDYVVRFSSDNIGIAKVHLDSSVKKINVVKGINEVIITTPSTIVNNNIIIDGIGFNVSDVQVVANVIKNGDIKDFDYFKGLQSSFENGLVTDENDENYGKYKVECKIVGKNKININKVLDVNSWTASDSYHYIKLQLKPNTNYIISKNKIPSEEVYLCISQGHSYREGITNIINGGWILHPTTPQAKRLSCGFITPISGVVYLCTGQPNSLKEFILNLGLTFQLEEGTQATPYEPYKESIHTLYLNSPLLKGDKLVVHDGKLCHYHKMGMVVLNGNNILPSNTNIVNGFLRIYMYKLDKKALYPGLNEYPNCYSNQLQTLTRNFWANFNIESVSISDAGQLTFSKKNDTLEGFKQWLQQNPTTVVYELAEPYYEPIEPQLSQYSFSTVKDGDMEIITTLPIEIDLTYRTDINGVSSIEEQIASIQESTDISSIIDEEVDE